MISVSGKAIHLWGLIILSHSHIIVQEGGPPFPKNHRTSKEIFWPATWSVILWPKREGLDPSNRTWNSGWKPNIKTPLGESTKNIWLFEEKRHVILLLQVGFMVFLSQTCGLGNMCCSGYWPHIGLTIVFTSGWQCWQSGPNLSSNAAQQTCFGNI